MDFQQHAIDADADGEPDAPGTFQAGVGFTAARSCPLSIDTTWVLAASWLLLAAGNLGIQSGMDAYLALPSVVLRAAVTVGWLPYCTSGSLGVALVTVAVVVL